MVGIKAFQEVNDVPEIESPFRKKKKFLGQLDISNSVMKAEPDAHTKNL